MPTVDDMVVMHTVLQIEFPIDTVNRSARTVPESTLRHSRLIRVQEDTLIYVVYWPSAV